MGSAPNLSNTNALVALSLNKGTSGLEKPTASTQYYFTIDLEKALSGKPVVLEKEKNIGLCSK